MVEQQIENQLIPLDERQGYRLQEGEALSDGVKRIAVEQLDAALHHLTQLSPDPDEAIHDARKRFKKARAVVRLVRDEVGEEVYQRDNKCFRDAGRLLSDVRDSAVMVETVDAVYDHFKDELYADVFAKLRKELVAAHEAILEQALEENNAAGKVIAMISAGRNRVLDWPINHDDFSAIEKGLKRVYRRGYKRMADAYEERSPASFHEWRKRVKYLWYHVRILRPIWDDVLDELADSIHDLSDYLGDHHDLTELEKLVQGKPEWFEDEREHSLLLGLIERRQTELEADARTVGLRVYSEKPKAFIERMEDYWQAYQLERKKGIAD